MISLEEYARRKQSKLCVVCGKTSAQLGILCFDCRNRRNARNRKNDSKKRKLWKKENKCSRCGKNKISSLFEQCEYCRDLQRKRAQRYKKSAIDFYGGKCQCCGEDNILFLTIDHLSGGGNAHRVLIGGSPNNSKIYRWLIKNNFPPGFKTACFSCNQGRWVNGGLCPHKDNNAEVL